MTVITPAASGDDYLLMDPTAPVSLGLPIDLCCGEPELPAPLSLGYIVIDNMASNMWQAIPQAGVRRGGGGHQVRGRGGVENNHSTDVDRPLLLRASACAFKFKVSRVPMSVLVDVVARPWRSAEFTQNHVVHKMDHLACFVGGMLVLGSEAGRIARRLVTSTSKSTSV